jgi:hypothetical protein
MTRPDPRGADRLSARLDILRAEGEIRTAFWRALSGWLIRLSRRVLRGDRPPDIDAVWTEAPAWREAVDRVIEQAIEPVMRRAYTTLIGDGYAWDQRLFVAEHLAEVRNRLVRVPEEVFGVIASEINEGVNLGEGIPQLTNRVDEALSVTTSERWQNRAETVARTEAIGALNAAKADAFQAMAQEEPGTRFERVWLATDDARTRETHRAADGQRVPLKEPFIVGGFPLMFPGDPSGPPQEVINCRCGQLLVEVGEDVDMSNRQYQGGAE